MSDHRDALIAIINICEKSENYSRRTQSIHNKAMIAIGFTESQRASRHASVLSRASQLKQDSFLNGISYAKREWKRRLKEETQEIL